MATHPLSPLLRPHVDSVLRAIPHLLGQSFATLLFCHHISPKRCPYVSESTHNVRGVPKQPESLWMAASRCFPGQTENTDQYLAKPCPYSPFFLTLTSSST
ncbi:hypothetical protein XENORESO_020402 [Xenotaenia resolanae]|uniref:Uncharacterized protein n=1 Tax=Xenotaenia resolanae TaxID=208358 RepID=A0ABV0WFZ0_9TELE